MYGSPLSRRNLSTVSRSDRLGMTGLVGGTPLGCSSSAGAGCAAALQSSGIWWGLSGDLLTTGWDDFLGRFMGDLSEYGHTESSACNLQSGGTQVIKLVDGIAVGIGHD